MDEDVVVTKKAVPRTKLTVVILNSLLKQIAAQSPDTFPHMQRYGKKGKMMLLWVEALKMSPLLTPIPASTLESWTDIAVAVAQNVFERSVKAPLTLDLTAPSSSSSSSSSSDVLSSSTIDMIATEYCFVDGDASTKDHGPRFPINDSSLLAKSASNADAKLAATALLQVKKDSIPLLHSIGKKLEKNAESKELERRSDREQEAATRKVKEARIAAGGDKPLKKPKYTRADMNGPFEGAERPDNVSRSSSSSSSSGPSDLFNLLAKLVENEGAASTPVNNAAAAASVTATRTPPPSVWRTGTIMLLKAKFPDNASLGIPGAEAVLDAAFLDMDTLLPYFVGQVEAFSRTEFTKKVSPPLPLILSDRIYAVLANKLALL